MDNKYIESLFESVDAILKQAKIIETLPDDPDMSEEDIETMYKIGNEKIDEALSAMYKAKDKFSK